MVEFQERTAAEILVVHHAHDKLAPFNYQRQGPKLQLVDREGLSVGDLHQLASAFAPTITYVAGWIDNQYLAITSRLKKEGIDVIAGIDTPWRADFRQRISTVMSFWFIHRFFTHAWIAGPRQREYARRLGFPDNKTIDGLYSGDVGSFACEPAPTKRFVFVGRLVKEKGLETFYAATKRILQRHPDWQSHIVGLGPMQPPPSVPGVFSHGFIEPNDLAEFASEGGVFVLPSLYEPWGVVVHEFAAAGFPLILSSAVGAGDRFLVDGENGFLVRPGDVEHLAECLTNMTGLTDAERCRMGSKSVELAKTITPESWTNALIKVCENGIA